MCHGQRAGIKNRRYQKLGIGFRGCIHAGIGLEFMYLQELLFYPNQENIWPAE